MRFRPWIVKFLKSCEYFPGSQFRIIMADGPSSGSSDNSSLEDTIVEFFSTKHDGPALENLLLKGERLMWTSDLETLKKFVEETIQQHGKWSSPGGATKTFKSDNNRLTITWYGGKQSTLAFQGKDGPSLKEQLVNFIQRNEAQKSIGDADLLPSDSTALQSGGQGLLATDAHDCPEDLVSNTHNMSFNDTASRNNYPCWN